MSDPDRSINELPGCDPARAEDLLPLIYEELRRVARARMASEQPGQTLQATALVHEAYLRLSSDSSRAWNDPQHFFSSAAEAMRRILVERARRRHSLKRGGGQRPLSLDEIDAIQSEPDDRILAVNEALEKLAEIDSVRADLVKLHFFAGLDLKQAGAALGLSDRTADRYWAWARAWLHREIRQSGPNR